MMTFRYRQATLHDLDALVCIGVASYSPYRAQLDHDQWLQMAASTESPRTYTDLLKVAACFICHAGQRPAGMAFIVPSGNPTPAFEPHWSYIRMVGVDPAFQGNGIAKRLTTLCIDHARSAGESFVALHTSEMMPAAQHIYTRLGFRRLNELPAIYNKRYWRYLLDLNADLQIRTAVGI